MPSIFISYRRTDATGEARDLRRTLARELPQVEIFRDITDLPPGVDFDTHIRSVVARCDLVLALIGKTWLAAERGGTRRLDDPSDWPRREIASALAQGKQVIPVLLYGTEMPSVEALPQDLRPLAGLNAFSLGDRTWERDVTDLAAWLRKLLLARPPSERTPANDRIPQIQSRTGGTPQRGTRPATATNRAIGWGLAAVLALGLYVAYRTLPSLLAPGPPLDSATLDTAPKPPDVEASRPSQRSSTEASAPREVNLTPRSGQVALVELRRIPISGTENRLRYDFQASADGALLASTHSDSTTRVLRVDSGAEIAAFRGLAAPAVGSVVRFSPNGRYLAVANRAGVIVIVDLSDASRLAPEVRLGSELTAMAFVGSTELLASGKGGVLALLTVKGRAVERSSPLKRDFGDAGNIGALSASSDGKLLAVVDARGTVRLGSAHSLTEGEVVGYTGSIDQAAKVLMSNDAKRLAWLSGDHRVTVLMGPDKKRTLSEQAQQMIFTGDGRYFITSMRNVLRIYDFSTLMLQAVFTENSGPETLFLAPLGKTSSFAMTTEAGPVLLLQLEKK